LADPASELAEEGRDLCRAIESATGVPTFYYLMRYWGRPKAEERRRCPGCGDAWRTERPREPPNRFWQFDFKCDRCRLVSHLGAANDGGRRVRVGEFDEKRKANRSMQGRGASRNLRSKRMAIPRASDLTTTPASLTRAPVRPIFLRPGTGMRSPTSTRVSTQRGASQGKYPPPDDTSRVPSARGLRFLGPPTTETMAGRFKS